MQLRICLQESKIDMSQLQLKPKTLAEMVSLIEDGTISGKIGKQVLPDLLQVIPFTHFLDCVDLTWMTMYTCPAAGTLQSMTAPLHVPKKATHASIFTPVAADEVMGNFVSRMLATSMGTIVQLWLAFHSIAAVPCCMLLCSCSLRLEGQSRESNHSCETYWKASSLS